LEDKRLKFLRDGILSFALPDGVIGNTWAFGAHIPGSSPGRVDVFSFKFLVLSF
jgi:hypothetical protein